MTHLVTAIGYFPVEGKESNSKINEEGVWVDMIPISLIKKNGHHHPNALTPSQPSRPHSHNFPKLTGQRILPVISKHLKAKLSELSETMS